LAQAETYHRGCAIRDRHHSSKTQGIYWVGFAVEILFDENGWRGWSIVEKTLFRHTEL
jgi:hypothetical protein